MPLETGTYISDLVLTNPAHSDSVGAADSHLRFIKATLLATFAGITGAVTATHTQLNTACAAVVTGLAQAVHISGTVGAPGVSFLGSLTTGLYSPAANKVAVATNGILAALFGSDQSLTVAGPYLGGTGQLGIIGEPRLWLSNTLPSGSFAWLNGSTQNRAANPVLFAMWGTTYGVGLGDGLTFSLPNFQDVVPIGRGGMGGATDPALVAASGVTANIGTIGAVIGEGKHTLTIGELATHTPVFTGTLVTPTFTGTSSHLSGGGSASGLLTGSGGAIPQQAPTGTISAITPAGTIAAIGSSTPHNVVQPAIVCNWIVLLG